MFGKYVQKPSTPPAQRGSGDEQSSNSVVGSLGLLDCRAFLEKEMNDFWWLVWYGIVALPILIMMAIALACCWGGIIGIFDRGITPGCDDE